MGVLIRLVRLVFFTVVAGVCLYTGVVDLQRAWTEAVPVTLHGLATDPPQSAHVVVQAARVDLGDPRLDGEVALLVLRPRGDQVGGLPLLTRDLELVAEARAVHQARQAVSQAETARALYDADADYRAFLERQGQPAPSAAAATLALAQALARAEAVGDAERVYDGWLEEGVLRHGERPSQLWAWARVVLGALLGLVGLLAILGALLGKGA